MTDKSHSDADAFFAALGQLRKATDAVSYAVLVREGGARLDPPTISAQRLSDWFGGKAIPDDPEVVRFLVGYLQPRAVNAEGYQQRPLEWWLSLHRRAKEERQERRNGTGGPIPAPRRLGRPISACTALELEVHPAVDVAGHDQRLPLLPAYVARAHDDQLREVVAAAAAGASRMVMLVGGSSTGKTRACWEAIQALPDHWRLWHPFDPTRPEAAAAALAEIGPNTVVWLNEAQHYLLPADPRLGERVAAGLRTLLIDPARGPVLVVGTTWPQHWTALTTPPPARGPDPYAQARQLLTGTEIRVPDAFTSSDLRALATAAGGDPRLRHAADRAAAGRITQQLAGVPELLRRYHTGTPVAQAAIKAAMDARRLGPVAIPRALLEQAVPGYLDDTTWTTIGAGWPAALDDALTSLGEPAHGILGPLTRIHPRPGDTPTAGGPHYRLADYLDQTGRTERAAQFPPASFWDAVAATVTDPAVLYVFGEQAHRRSRYHRAAQLYRSAADRGHIMALVALAHLHGNAADDARADALYQQVIDLGGNFEELSQLARLRLEIGVPADAEARAMLAGDHSDTEAVLKLAEQRPRTRDRPDAEALAALAAPLGIRGLDHLFRQRVGMADLAGAEVVAIKAAERGDTGMLQALVDLRTEAGITANEDLYRYAVDCGDLGARLGIMQSVDGDTDRVERIWRFGLTEDGTPAASLEW